MELFLQYTLNGVVIGLAYALFAAGFSIVFGSLKALNFAYGLVFIGASYVSWIASSQFGIPIFPFGIILAMIAGGLLNILCERLTYAPLRKRGGTEFYFQIAIATIALAMALQNSYNLIFSADPVMYPKMDQYYQLIRFGGVSASYIQLINSAVALLMIAGLFIILKYTRYGLAIRAISFKPETAKLLAINTERTILTTFFIGGCLAGAAGCLMTVFLGMVGPYLADVMFLKALLIIVIGGMGSLPGAIIAGLLMGLAESYSVAYISSSFKDVTGLVIFFIILLIRPAGLFGKRLVTRA